jgi:glc operon protein GlcG
MFAFAAERRNKGEIEPLDGSIPREKTMRTSRRAIVVAIVSLALTAGAWAQKLADKKGMTLAVAKQLAAAAESEAAKNKFTMVIVVVDDGGNLVYLEKMDETQIGSIEVAQAKAHTAIAFKRPTKVFQDAVAGGNTAILKLPGVVATEGGLPLVVDGKIIGAIGVSGGTSAQDSTVAQAAVDALPKILAQ